MKWYVLQVYSGFENKVIETINVKLLEKGLSDFVSEMSAPNVKISDNASEKVKKQLASKKILIGYVLIKMNLTKEILSLILSVPRVSKFLGEPDSQGLPYSISEKDVEDFLLYSESASTTEDSIIETFSVGEEVRIISEPFYDFKGVIENIDQLRKRIRVSVLIFGRSTPVDLEYKQIEKLS